MSSDFCFGKFLGICLQLGERGKDAEETFQRN